MTMLANSFATRPLVLRLSTAAELMTGNPLKFEQHMPVHKATALLAYHNLEAAPVVDQNGRPLGIVSKSNCEDWREYCLRSSPHGFVSEDLDLTTVDEIMNPIIETVPEYGSSRDVIEKLVDRRLRRVYVVNEEDQLIGVISTADVLGQLLVGDISRRSNGAAASMLC